MTHIRSIACAALLYVFSGAAFAPSGALAQQYTGALAPCAEGVTLDAKIAACTSGIDGGKITGAGVAEALYLRGKWYVEKNEPDKALADFTRAIQINSQWTPAVFQRAQLHAKAGRKWEAVADYQRVLELFPGDQGALDGLKALGVQPPPPRPVLLPDGGGGYRPKPSGGGGGGDFIPF